VHTCFAVTKHVHTTKTLVIAAPHDVYVAYGDKGSGCAEEYHARRIPPAPLARKGGPSTHYGDGEEGVAAQQTTAAQLNGQACILGSSCAAP
jgi:hypothetical protein